MSTAPSTLEHVDTQAKPKPRPPLWHYVCPCQRQLGPDTTPRALCGCPIRSRVTRDLRGIPAPDHCVVCHEMHAAKTPCPHCGKALP